MYSYFIKSQLANRSYNLQLHDELTLHDLSASQWGLIRYIFEVGPATFSEVASYWKVEKPSVTPIAQKLVEKEMVFISPGKDKRQKVMHLSEKGVELYKQIKHMIDVFQEELVVGISQEEREIAEEVLDKLLINLTKRGC
ncbi:MarR family winged helix-turn-helix transcriptional regulator [Niallia sp. Krafla_26]|uniref:MarR family winged helix-turn-helix transcriptional regulator n=1 Tax=Niallia sp. Krafla_26 TaxID=3064703 RepID=UPI003D1665FB